MSPSFPNKNGAEDLQFFFVCFICQAVSELCLLRTEVRTEVRTQIKTISLFISYIPHISTVQFNISSHYAAAS